MTSFADPMGSPGKRIASGTLGGSILITSVPNPPGGRRRMGLPARGIL